MMGWTSPGADTASMWLALKVEVQAIPAQKASAMKSSTAANADIQTIPGDLAKDNHIDQSDSAAGLLGPVRPRGALPQEGVRRIRSR